MNAQESFPEVEDEERLVIELNDARKAMRLDLNNTNYKECIRVWAAVTAGQNYNPRKRK